MITAAIIIKDLINACKTALDINYSFDLMNMHQATFSYTYSDCMSLNDDSEYLWDEGSEQLTLKFRRGGGIIREEFTLNGFNRVYSMLSPY